ncbi:T-lymphocyte surface antigen Ly-9-like isoform X2 [Lemur catta]|uniref:T-lymphocyte surface antigen Ly-9-like isoform X2 n=1 Tax=Lemur catta TaxID=9447 RepID=UPI001E26CDE5|nr:T-lymphocyte surface antigen Ly-9-like isoform X2 [Lemur catta]
MGPCSEHHLLCLASSVPRFITLLLSVCRGVGESSGANGSAVKDSGAHIPLNRIRGDSVLFDVTKNQGAILEVQPEELSWSFSPESDYTVMFRIQRGVHSPRWFGLQDKFKQRVQVPSLTSLRISNLTLQDSGQYRAQATLTEGREVMQVFHLTVYEPIPHPNILVQSLSIALGWCNVTLECRAPRATRNLNVTWESRGLPTELEQRGTPGPALDRWILVVRLPPSQPNASITCVVSNHMEQKSATKDLGDICAQDSHGWDVGRLLAVILGPIVVLMLILGAISYLWKTHGKKKNKKTKKKMEPERGTRLQEDHRVEDDSIHYEELMKQETQGISVRHVEGKGPMTTVYTEVRKPGRAMNII